MLINNTNISVPYSNVTNEVYKWKSLLTSIEGLIKIDHITISVSKVDDLPDIQSHLTSEGGTLMLPLQEWPSTEARKKITPTNQSKFMLAVKFETFFIVVVAPKNKEDQIASFMNGCIAPKLHHIALSVANIDETKKQLTKYHGLRALGEIDESNIYLQQVFMKNNSNNSFLELVWRKNKESIHLDDSNIAALTASMECS